MHNFWSEDVPYITLFGADHLIFIGIFLICLFLLFKNHKHVRQYAEQYRKIFLVISLAQQILLYSWYFFETGFDVSESLPLHISRITSILGIIYLVTRNRYVLEVVFYFGLFAYGSFLLPERVHPIYHAMGISFLVNHVLTLLIPMFAYIAYDFRPTKAGLFRSFGWFLVYFFFVLFLNPLIDGNYFYLKYRPFLNHWPDLWYNTFAIVGTFIVFWLGYGLFHAVDYIFSRNTNQARNKIITQER